MCHSGRRCEVVPRTLEECVDLFRVLWQALGEGDPDNIFHISFRNYNIGPHDAVARQDTYSTQRYFRRNSAELPCDQRRTGNALQGSKLLFVTGIGSLIESKLRSALHGNAERKPISTKRADQSGRVRQKAPQRHPDRVPRMRHVQAGPGRHFGSSTSSPRS